MEASVFNIRGSSICGGGWWGSAWGCSLDLLAWAVNFGGGELGSPLFSKVEKMIGKGKEKIELKAFFTDYSKERVGKCEMISLYGKKRGMVVHPIFFY